LCTIRPLAEEAREPGVNGWGKLKPPFQVIGIIRAYLNPHPLCILLYSPIVFATPAARRHKNKSGSSRIDTKGIGSPLLIIAIRFRLHLAIRPKLPNRETVWHIGISAFDLNDTVPPAALYSFTGREFYSAWVLHCRMDEAAKHPRQLISRVCSVRPGM
jgi:hypothetical protein